MALSQEDRDEIASLIKTVVNGKIDRLEGKVDAQLDVLEPVADAIIWINSTRKFILYIGTIAAAVASLFALGKYVK